LERPDELALDVDRVGRRYLGQTRYGHDLAANCDHELERLQLALADVDHARRLLAVSSSIRPGRNGARVSICRLPRVIGMKTGRRRTFACEV